MDSIIVHSNHNYENLLCYKKAVVIYDLTYHFCMRYVDAKSRTFDQMIQAARSGKQNIVEGTVDMSSSFEMMLKLINVARGSLKELLEDYKDYLRVNKLRLWQSDSKEVDAMRRVGIDNTESEYFLKLAETRNDEVVANMVIVLLYQADVLLMRYIRHIEAEFAEHGGIKERMYTVRTQNRGY